SALTEKAVAAGDRKWHDDAIPWFQVGNVAAYLDNFSHELVPQDVALLHRRNEAIVEMQVRSADRRGCNPDNGVPCIQYLRIRNFLDPDIVFVVPASCFHNLLCILSSLASRSSKVVHR